MLRCLLRGYLQWLQPRLCWGLGRSCLFTFLNGKSSVQAKNLATFQRCYFCSFYSEIGIGLRKRSEAH